MAAGLVVLGSDATGAVLDRIRHGENGFIHRSGDVDQLAEQIGDLFLHPEILQDVGCRARLTAEQWPVGRGVQTIKSILAETAAPGVGP
jgi:glycosyltransferase involved in cell wall biosynthesis